MSTATTDDKARLVLPKSFANSTVLIESISDTELRIRKARVIPEDELRFAEEAAMSISDQDRDLFLEIIEKSPPPNDALRNLFASTPNLPKERTQREFPSSSINILSLPWSDFMTHVRAEQHPPGVSRMRERIEVLREIGDAFARGSRFSEFDYVTRRKVAGLFKSTEPNFLLFGSMRWVGHFKKAIKENNPDISLALDEIPLQGEVPRHCYERFADRFLAAFERSGMALASRLLAMKRPDTFVCVNNQNRSGLFEAFRLSDARDANSYWALVEKIQMCPWWRSAAPSAGDERQVWNARAAFLDALFFSGIGL
jgi:hypothetical protein